MEQAFLIAACKGDLPRIIALIEQGCPVDANNKVKCTCIHSPTVNVHLKPTLKASEHVNMSHSTNTSFLLFHTILPSPLLAVYLEIFRELKMMPV